MQLGIHAQVVADAAGGIAHRLDDGCHRLAHAPDLQVAAHPSPIWLARTTDGMPLTSARLSGNDDELQSIRNPVVIRAADVNTE